MDVGRVCDKPIAPTCPHERVQRKHAVPTVPVAYLKKKVRGSDRDKVTTPPSSAARTAIVGAEKPRIAVVKSNQTQIAHTESYRTPIALAKSYRRVL